MKLVIWHCVMSFLYKSSYLSIPSLNCLYHHSPLAHAVGSLFVVCEKTDEVK